MSDIKNALDKLAEKTLELTKIEIDGVEGEMFASAMTIGDVAKINAQSKSGDNMDEGIYTIINKLVDGQGNRIYTVGDKQKLKAYPANLIVEIIGQINSLGEMGSQAEAEKD